MRRSAASRTSWSPRRVRDGSWMRRRRTARVLQAARAPHAFRGNSSTTPAADRADDQRRSRADQQEIDNAQELLPREPRREPLSGIDADPHRGDRSQGQQQQTEIGVDARRPGTTARGSRCSCRSACSGWRGWRPCRRAGAQIDRVDKAAAPEHRAEDPAERTENAGPFLARSCVVSARANRLWMP